MSDTPRVSGYPGIGFPGLLTLIFITLKLTHVIDWSWWWVLSPLLIGLALIAAILLVWGGAYLIVRMFTK